MGSHSTTTQTINRVVTHPAAFAGSLRAVIVGMCGGVPLVQIRPPGEHPEAQRKGVADNGGLRRAKDTGDASGPASVLARIEVVFYKEILDDHGFPHRCELMCVPGNSVVPDEAIAGAILEFEQAQRVSNWTFAADAYEVRTPPAVA